MKLTRVLFALALVPVSSTGCLLLSGRCIYELRGVVASGQLIQAPADTVSAELNLGAQRQHGLFDVLAGSRGIIVITTDIPGRTTIQFRLNVTSKSDWNRPYCS